MTSNDSEQDGWYTTSCGNCIFTLPTRYQNLVHIGYGTYGAVGRATDILTGKSVAIKKLLQPFQTHIHAKRTYRELKVLIHLNHPDSQVVQLYNVFTPEKNANEFKTLYLVFNDAGCDLNRMIKKLPPTESYVKHMTYSILRGLKFIHSADIIHRDLKPSNIGTDRNSNATILDFGLARVESTALPTAYISSRWWRAPEVFLNEQKYDKKVDIWPVGCIMAELILHKPLFPGNDVIEQLNKIIDLLGTPNETTLNEICSIEAASFILKMEPKPRKDFHELFGYKYDSKTPVPISGVSPEGVDLLERLLSFDPRQRPTVEEALAHPFLENFHDPMQEPTIDPMIDEHQDVDYTKEQWISIVWQTVQEFSSPSWINDDSDDDS
ncbi:unnamed protein product [Rotaria magnacalcarata]|uniref:Protein kinase domain-containing protein n=1 Tax=Rotaria magnacalcarata TaxID=392030 RepID=A0A816LX87_9BILA|nr:unnamed protein product [Rotaria magnacalcarata]